MLMSFRQRLAPWRVRLTVVAVLALAAGCTGTKTTTDADLAVVPVPGVELAVVVAEPTLNPIVVDARAMGADPAIVALLEPYAAQVREFQTTIAHNEVEMVRPTDKKGDWPLGNWMADVTRVAAEASIGAPVDLALMNGGGIRATLPAGPITRESILKVMPFENKIVVVELTGADTLALLENLGKYPRSFAVSNAIITHDATPALVGATIGGVPFNASRSYRVALSDFLADGGDGVGALLKPGTRTDTGILVRDAMEAYVRALAAAGKKITPPAESSRYIDTTANAGGSGS